MSMQDIFKLKDVIVLLFLLFVGINHGYSRDPAVIGTSNRSDATAYNNARKIVRTSDDRRVVVFQDSTEGQSVVKWTYSDDGFQWSEPEVLANGSFPAVAVSKDDWIYVVWSSYNENNEVNGKYLEKGSLNWQDGDVVVGIYPSVDATEEYVHIVSQSIYTAGRILYERCDQHASDGRACSIGRGPTAYA